jgi:hypothetical protein
LQAGKVSSLEEILPDFLSAKPEKQSDILKKVEEEASKLEGADAGYLCNSTTFQSMLLCARPMVD